MNMNKSKPRNQKVKPLLVTIVGGLSLSLLTGLLRNSPEFSIIGATYYGYPLVWRITKTLQPADILHLNLVLDIAFWTLTSFLALVTMKKVAPKGRCFQTSRGDSKNPKHKTFFLFLILFLPLGLAMDLIHELGHALCGKAVGGTLTCMKIAFFQIYPSFAITPEFILGYAAVDGVSSSLARGVFLLGGSLTTNMASWLIALILLKISLGHKAQVALWTLGLFGLLDLPFYIFLPQMGLQHWLFLGGSQVEPLIGAKLMGIPDPIFHLIVGLTTLMLIFLYVKALKSIRHQFQCRKKGGQPFDTDRFFPTRI